MPKFIYQVACHEPFCFCKLIVAYHFNKCLLCREHVLYTFVLLLKYGPFGLGEDRMSYFHICFSIEMLIFHVPLGS